MTVPVPDQLEYISDADGVTKDFSYPKRFLQKDEIVVLLRDADGVDTPQILNTHYTIAGSSWPSGGTISFINAPQAPNKVVRYRMTQAKQTVDLENNQRNDAPSVELQLDRLTMAIQDRGRLGDSAWWGLLAEIAARVQGDKLLNDRVDQEIIDRTNGDEALASLIGQAGPIEVPMFDTRLAVTFANIKPSINAIRTSGYTNAGDGGGALYKRVATEPTHAGKVRSWDGAWWEMIGSNVSPHQFGGIAGQDIWGASQAALDYLQFRGGGQLTFSQSSYELGGILTVPSDVTIVAHGAYIKRTSTANAMLLNKSDGITGGWGANRNIHVIGGTWDGNSADIPEAATLIAFGHCDNVSVKQAMLINTPGRWHAIEFNAVRRGRISDNYIDNGGFDDIDGEAIQIDAALAGGPFPWFGPYDDTPCLDIEITGNFLINWATACGSHSLPTNEATRHSFITIANNYFEVSRCGIGVLRWTDVTIENNRIVCSSFSDQDDAKVVYGVFVKPHTAGRTTAIRIRNNVIDGFKRGTPANGNSRAIFISGTNDGLFRISNISVEENYCVNNGRHGITADFSDLVHIRNNTVNITQRTGIFLWGSRKSDVVGNTVTGQINNTYVDVDINNAGTTTAIANIVTSNMADKFNITSQSTLACSNIANVSISGTSAGGKVGPNLVAGVWV